MSEALLSSFPPNSERIEGFAYQVTLLPLQDAQILLTHYHNIPSYREHHHPKIGVINQNESKHAQEAMPWCESSCNYMCVPEELLSKK